MTSPPSSSGSAHNHPLAISTSRPESSVNTAVAHRRCSSTAPGRGEADGGSRQVRSCFFCWCCCCSFSWLTEQDGPVNKSSTGHSENTREVDEMPTQEELRLWSISFEALMKSAKGTRVFRDFLRSEYSEENMLFWLACEDLKKAPTEKVEEAARALYEDYISILSPKEVSLDARVRDLINQKMVSPNKSTFDEAQLQIYTLMHRDSYPRFLHNYVYKHLKSSNELPNVW